MHTSNIAIDGPAGAGKSTVARLVAEKLDFKYIDTGAMYRALTWKVLQQGLSFDDWRQIAETAASMDVKLETTRDGTNVHIDGEDITEAIRSPRVTSHVSAVASLAAVRDVLVRKQQQMAAAGGVVMDGRDIGTKVLPDAKVKVFLTASIEERARRRFHEMREKGIEAELKQLKRDIAHRDELDSRRSASPLKKASDAIIIDTTGLTISQVVAQILALARTKLGTGE